MDILPLPFKDHWHYLCLWWKRRFGISNNKSKRRWKWKWNHKGRENAKEKHEGKRKHIWFMCRKWLSWLVSKNTIHSFFYALVHCRFGHCTRNLCTKALFLEVNIEVITSLIGLWWLLIFLIVSCTPPFPHSPTYVTSVYIFMCKCPRCLVLLNLSLVLYAWFGGGNGVVSISLVSLIVSSYYYFSFSPHDMYTHCVPFTHVEDLKEKLYVWMDILSMPWEFWN